MDIPYTHHRLANGLDVVIHEDHGCPIVAVNVWYHVGSKNEVPGRTGFAHLFEHLMFEGSQHHDRGYFHPLQQAGALLNGSTNADRTNYWEVVPTNALELALWMESDRMGYLLPALTDHKFGNQRDVVLNERRQNYENRPYGLAGMAIVAALYPPDHPYHWVTIGSAEDIRAARLDDVKTFFETYYRPRNASIALAGDIDTDRALAMVTDYFAPLDAGDEPPPVSYVPPAAPAAEIRLLLEDRVELPRLYMSWHTPGLFQPDDAELDLVADVLSGGKTSRLYRALVFEQRIATEIAASQNSREIGGYFQIVATAAPGRTLVELDAAIERELAGVRAHGPTAVEMERCQAQAEAAFVYRLQTVGGFGGKSDQLNAYNVFLGNPGYFDRDLARYHAVSASGIQQAARSWLRPEARVVLSAVPHGRADLALPGIRTRGGVLMAVDRSRLPVPGAEAPFTFPEIRRRTLANGLRVWTAEHHAVPLVSCLVLLPVGASADPVDRPGLAAVTSDMLDEGCGDLDAMAVHEALGRLGSHVDTEIGSDATLLTLTALTRFAPRGVSLLADMIIRPQLTAPDFDRVRELRLNRLVQMRDMPPALADRRFAQALYGDHPYGHLPIGTEASLRALTIEEVRAFHQRMYAPSRMTVIAAGDGTHDELADLVASAFGSWSVPESDAPPDVTAMKAPRSPDSRIALVHRPGAAQSELRIGHVAVPRATPDYHALLVLNMVLGGQFVSRINMNLREDKGYTYGARTAFEFRKAPGPFVLQASVQSEATVNAVIESLAELRAIRGERPVTSEEIETGRATLTRGYPRSFETADQVSRGAAQLAMYGLPDDYFTTFVPRVLHVDAAAVTDAAARHIDPDRLVTVIVGDRDKVLADLPRLGLGEAVE